MRINPLPEIEKDICGRLRAWRDSVGISRRKLALSINVTPELIDSVEQGRAPLRYILARKIVSAINISPVWLATGIRAELIGKELPSAESLGVNPRSLFSKVFHDHLAEKIEPAHPLLPCPFCGGLEIKPQELSTPEILVCQSCHAVGPMAISGCEAARLWNERSGLKKP